MRLSEAKCRDTPSSGAMRLCAIDLTVIRQLELSILFSETSVASDDLAELLSAN
ncbi:hypothetical protein [Vibrio cyclitrophicus]|uniref:hypothetical protein n=1 Tax=Vibrio cyclitrophicus TaxID=47951 RepID=UPI00031266B2|nr:hypothetical protein [Vibrio cyclitrophicus]